MNDKAIKNLARNMRRCCKKTSIDDCLYERCKYSKQCGKLELSPVSYNSIKELADELKEIVE